MKRVSVDVMSNPSVSMDTNPPLPRALLIETQLELVSSMTVAGTLYGTAFSLYCLYLHASLPHLRDHNRRRQAQFMITLSSIIMLCGLYYLVANASTIQDAYIKHANFPGGPLLYLNSTFLTQPAIAVGFVCQSVVDISTAAIQIWRLWVVWGASRYYVRFVVVLFPLLCFLGFTAMRIRTTVLDITLTGSEYWSQNFKPAIGEYALQTTIAILPSILIAGFLIFQSRRQKKLIGESQLSTPYMSIVAILVESYVMESIWTILFVIFLAIGHPALRFFADTLLYIEIIAYLLVLYRVANGRAYGSQRAHEPQSGRNNLSSLHWNHTTTTESGVASGPGTDVNIHLPGNKPESDILQVQGSPA